MQSIESFNLTGLVAVCADGELRVSSLLLAHGMGQQHRAVLQLTHKHIESLEKLGRVAFEVQSFQTKGGAQSREVAMLNEQQSTLLICLMRNSQRVVQFKISLVQEFYRMKAELARREQNLWQQMQTLIAKEVDSQVRASFGSHLMLTRRRELPQLREERGLLESAMQPSLLN